MKGTDIEIKPYDPSQACGDGQGIRDIVRDMGDALQDIIHAHDTAYSRGLGTTAKSLRRIMADLDGRREHLMRLHEGGGVQTS